LASENRKVYKEAKYFKFTEKILLVEVEVGILTYDLSEFLALGFWILNEVV
jgi:hypothetical protein